MQCSSPRLRNTLRKSFDLGRLVGLGLITVRYQNTIFSDKRKTLTILRIDGRTMNVQDT